MLSAPQDRDAVLKAAVAALKKADPKRVVTRQRTFDDLRADFFADDRAMAGILVGVIIALLTITALGIVGSPASGSDSVGAPSVCVEHWVRHVATSFVTPRWRIFCSPASASR